MTHLQQVSGRKITVKQELVGSIPTPLKNISQLG